MAFILCTFDGLWYYDKNTKNVKKLPFSNNNIIIVKVKIVDNLLYVATDGHGFFIYDTKTQKVILNENNNSKLSSQEVTDILVFPDKQEAWLTTAKGVDVYNLKTKEISNLLNNTVNKFLSITYIDNKIFVTNMGSGIYVFNQQKELLKKHQTVRLLL